MTGSLNPVDFADKLGTVPQLHLVGSDDSVVPASIARAYETRLRNARKLRIVPIEDYDHICCWARDWRRLRQELTPE